MTRLNVPVARIREDGRVLDKFGNPLAKLSELPKPSDTRANADIYVLGPSDSDDGLPVGSIIIRTSEEPPHHG